ncbi:cobalamin biosynthesis protein [Nocardioides insulae]|uniref:cobalamin biosynthesis protein n=1 Tax=Nocardioides insulae TaxID=394734 RepID=UPI000413CE7E|nr:cobalamin biosynthesis protein [Nocardioides insulae]
MSAERAIGIMVGVAADRILGDPARWHPVAGFGRLATGLETAMYADRRSRGAAYVLVLVGGTTAAAALAERRGGHRCARTMVTAAVTWAVLGGRSLDREAARVTAHLASGDLDAARRQLTHLVGRDPSALDADGVARAVVESVAENTSDAVVTPLVWGALLGVPGLVLHRTANTLDAMVGHHSTRYERFGWAAARLDDLLGLPGSRLTAILATALGPDPRGALRAWRRDAAAHPSPNAGVVEAAFAGALGLRLGGRTVYPHRVEHRPVLGDGRPPRPADIPRVRRLATRVGVASGVGAGLVAGLVTGGLGRTARRRLRPLDA